MKNFNFLRFKMPVEMNIRHLKHPNFREKGELPICEVANYLFCGVKVIGATENCIDFLNSNQEKYIFQVFL